MRSRRDFIYIQASSFKYRVSCGVVAMRMRPSAKGKAFGPGSAVAATPAVVSLLGAPQTDGTGVRLGVTVTKRVGNAPIRNRWKRIVREAFRLCRVSWTLSNRVDMVVIIKPGARFLSSEDMQNSLNSAMRRWEKVSRGKS